MRIKKKGITHLVFSFYLFIYFILKDIKKTENIKFMDKNNFQKIIKRCFLCFQITVFKHENIISMLSENCYCFLNLVFYVFFKIKKINNQTYFLYYFYSTYLKKKKRKKEHLKNSK